MSYININDSSKTYYVAANKQFYIFFRNEEVMKLFKEEYKNSHGVSKSGFFKIQKQSGEKGEYRIYTNAHTYLASAFIPKDYIKPIGIRIGNWNNGGYYPISQSQTVESALKSITVTGIQDINIRMLNKSISGTNNINDADNGAPEFFAAVSQMQARINSSLENYDESLVITQQQVDFLEQQLELVNAKKEYETENIIPIPYDGIETVLQNTQDGSIYKFNIGYIENDKLSDKLNSGAPVKITSNASGFFVYGVLIDYKDDQLLIKTKCSYDQLASKGTITEKENVEYKIKEQALNNLLNKESPNKYIVDIIHDSRTIPINITKSFSKETDLNGNKLNPSQINAIEKALNTTDFLLVQGPPGTGKTTIITEMIHRFVNPPPNADGTPGKSLRVLICSKNNLAVDNVMEKCQNLYYDKEKRNKMQCLRLGNEEKVIESVKCVLRRSVTQRIQEDISAKSKQGRSEYISNAEMRMEKINASKRDTQILTQLTLTFIGIKEMIISIEQQYHKNGSLKFLFFRKGSSRFLYLIEMIKTTCDNLISDFTTMLSIESVLIESNTTAQFQFEIGQIANGINEINSLISASKYAQKRIFIDPNITVASIAYNYNSLLPQLTANTVSLVRYTGNQAADVMRQYLRYPRRDRQWFTQYITDVFCKIDKLKENIGCLQQTLDRWNSELISDNEKLAPLLLKTVKIVGATCIGVCTNSDMRDAKYDVAIVDEAGQITLHDIIVPLSKAKKVIMIGDHLQLPPTGERDFCNYLADKSLLGFGELDNDDDIKQYQKEIEETFSVSLFEKLFRDPSLDDHKVMLDTQFRMHPVIASFISDKFYGGKYKSGVSAEDRTLKIAGMTEPMYFVDTVNCKDKTENNNANPKVRSYSNSLEADICGEMISKIIDAIENDEYSYVNKKPVLKGDDGYYDIGVITAYKAQIPLLKKSILERLSSTHDKKAAKDMVDHLYVNTLDSFQGRDNQIIIYSFVRSNLRHTIGFQNEVRRLNVMMTRAKSLLIMVGDSETLTNTKALTVHDNKKASGYYTDLIDYCKENAGYIDYSKEHSHE